MVIGICHVVGEDGAAKGHSGSRDHVQVLDRDRHAQQWRKLVRLGGLRDHALGLAGLLACTVRGYREERADLWAYAVDPLQIVFECFDR